MQANRQRMEKTLQANRNQGAVQQSVQRPTSVQRPGGVEISMNAVAKDAKQHIKENFNTDGTKRQETTQNTGREQHSASQVKTAENAAERGQNTVQRQDNYLQFVKNREQPAKGPERER